LDLLNTKLVSAYLKFKSSAVQRTLLIMID
jgi:hypothetical protein